MNELDKALGAALMALGIIVAISSLIALVVVLFVMPERSCKQRAEVMGFPYIYSISTGCMIRVNHRQWIPIDSFRYPLEDMT